MNTEFGFIPFIGQPYFLLDIVIKSTVILVSAFVMTRLMRHSSASVRHYVWGVAIFATLALPVINGCLPKWTIDAFSASNPAADHSIESLPDALPLFKNPHPALMSVPASKPQQQPASRNSSVNVVEINSLKNIPALLPDTATFWNVFWLTGVVLMLIRLAIMRIQLQTVSRECDVVTEGRLFDSLETCRAELGHPQSVRLLITDQPIIPMTWGVLHPSILLPRETESWPEHEVRCVFLHELAHVSRRDCLSQLVVQISCALYWFNPLVWIAARCVLIERELACDDIVLRNGTRASDYVAQLMQVVSRFQSNRMLESTTVSMAARNGFAQRLKAILHETQDRRPVRLRTMVSLVVAFIGLTGLLGVFQITFTGTAHAQQVSPIQTAEQETKPESNVQESIAKPPEKKEAKSVPETPPTQEKSKKENRSKRKAQSQELLNGRKRAVPVPDANRPATRSLNIVFAHDPGIGNYDGIVGRPHDVWNSVDIGTTAVDYTRYSDASPSTARLRITRHDGEWGITGQTGIFHGYIYHNCRCVDLETKVLDLPTGKYKIYVFAHGDAPEQNADIELKIGQRTVGRKATANDGTWDFRTQPYREGLQYVSFDFTIRAGEELDLISHRAGSDYSMFNAIQIVPLTKQGK
tara:strand:+ start:22881 stop:24800 length:1920 start_codon:yes stop_codon:yes gene_type:complete